VLALAGWHAPKFFNSGSASTSVSDGGKTAPSSPPVEQPVPSTTKESARVAKQQKTDAPVRNEPKDKDTVVLRGVLRQVPVTSPPVTQSQPVETAQNTQPVTQQPPPAVQTYAAPQANLQEIDDLRERLILLGTRAGSIKGSLDSMRRQMGGLNLNAEFTTREQRMEIYLDQADGALKGADAARAKKNLDSAERVVEELEKKLGR
jgi:hypothetical protein